MRRYRLRPKLIALAILQNRFAFGKQGSKISISNKGRRTLAGFLDVSPPYLQPTGDLPHPPHTVVLLLWLPLMSVVGRWIAVHLGSSGGLVLCPSVWMSSYGD